MTKLYTLALALGLSFLVGQHDLKAQCYGAYGASETQPQVETGSTVNTSTTLTVVSTYGFAAGMGVTGTGIPGGTTVVSILSATTIQLSAAATVTGAGSYTFTTPWVAFPSITPWGNQLPPTTGAGSNCSYSGTFTVPVCSNNYARIYMCATNSYTLSLCGGAVWDSFLTLTDNLGNAVSPATFNDNACAPLSSVTFTPSVSNLFFLRITTAGSCTPNPNNCGTLVISVSPVPTPPANDSPCTAFSLNPVGPACNPLATTGSFATQSAAPTSTGLCAPFSGFDVWYTATVPLSGNLSLQVEHVSALNMAMAAYTLSGACPGGTWTMIGCNQNIAGPTLLNPFLSFSGLTPGATIYVRVWPEGGVGDNGTFEICAYEPVPPANDNPCGAAPLPVSAPCTPSSFTTESATNLSAAMTTVPAAPTCGAPLSGGDVWFSFVGPPSGSVTISTLPGSISNMAMAVYSLTAGTICAGTLTQIGCDDNSGVGATMPRLTLPVTNGVTYYIRMWNQAASFGTFSICVYPNTPPTNDEPCSAIPLTVNPGCLLSSYTTEFATNTPTNPPSTVNIPVPGAPCAGTPNNDVWFTAVVPSNGVLEFDTDNGSMTDAALTVYTTGGTSCASGNLTLTQVGCSTGGSTNGAAMPYLSLSGLPAGQTVYIRVWRQTASTGTFLLCARTTVPPAGNCNFVLRMTDSGGDGWNGSYVTVTVNGVPTNYTINGATGSITIGANFGDVIVLTYTAVGGFQNQIHYQLVTPVGGIIFSSATPPASPGTFAMSVDTQCNVPPAPVSDCVGALQVCNNQTITGSPVPGNGNVQDLSNSNHGCLSGNEIRGVWIRFTAQVAGTIAFTINVPNGTDYDFAVWGPYAGSVTCPPAGAPLRCSWSGATGPTGLNYTAADLTENAGGDKWVRWIDALAGQTFMLYVDNWSNNGVTFNLNWNLVPANMLDCTLPLELLTFEADAKPRQVDLHWVTGTEQGTSYFQVERAGSDEHFIPLGRVQAAGFSQTLREYSFVDAAPLKGVNYYRLDQVDSDGAQEYSKTVTAIYHFSNLAMAIYPNPAGESVYAAFEMPGEGTVRWRIMDMSGRIVLDGPAIVSSGMNQVEIPLTRVEAGSYVLELLNDAGVNISNARFVKQ